MAMTNRRLSARFLLLGLSIMLGLVVPSLPASAAYPGENGLIAWQHSGSIYVGGPGEDASFLAIGYDPVWSPNGLELAFEGIGGTISIVDSGGVATQPVTEGKEPTWSPDGLRIAFSSSRGGDAEIYVVDRDGATLSQLTMNMAYDSKPAWSPDGSKIAFSSDRSGDTEIYVMNADGTNPTQLTYHPDVDSNPAWSPDGTKIAYSSITSRLSYFEWNEDIMVIPAWGGAPTRISPDPLDDEYPVHDSYPAWSPDGTKIVFQSDTYRVFDCPAWPTLPWKCRSPRIWIMNADGSNWQLVTEELGSRTPDWQPMPKLPAFPGTETVGLVDPATGKWLLAYPDGAVTSFYYGDPGDVPVAGDWDCDGVDTPGLFRLSDAFAYLRNSNTQGNADIRFFFGNPSDMPLAGDFNGDGCDTLSIYRPSEQRFYIMNALGENEGGIGAADHFFDLGNPGDKPVVGDWDGDGIDEVGLHRESTGFFYWRNTLDTGIASGQIFFGDPGDRFVSGDWGGADGPDTPAIFRPGDLTFYFRHTLTEGVADRQFTWTGAGTNRLPVSGTFGLS